MVSKRGFTLTEMIVSGVIIASLAAVVIVQYAKNAANAKSAQAKTVVGGTQKAANASAPKAVAGPAPSSSGVYNWKIEYATGSITTN